MTVKITFRTCTNGETKCFGASAGRETREEDRIAREAASDADRAFGIAINEIEGFAADFDVTYESSSHFADWHGGRWREGAEVKSAFEVIEGEDGDELTDEVDLPEGLADAIERASDAALAIGQKVVDDWGTECDREDAEAEAIKAEEESQAEDAE